MCEICDNLHKVSTKTPLQFTCSWAHNNHNCSITNDLSKCTIERYDIDGNIEVSIPFKFCPACGHPIVSTEKVKTFEDVVKREG